MAKTAQDYLAELKSEQAKQSALSPLEKSIQDYQRSQLESARVAQGMLGISNRGFRNAASTLGDERNNQLANNVINANNTLAGTVLRNSVSPTTGSYGMSDAELKAEANKREAYDLARGAVTRVTEDPIDKLIRDQLQQVALGKNVPYNDEVRNAMFSEQADMGAAANANRAEKILAQATERGLNPNDPGVQAALRQSLTEQQLGAQGARQDIAKTANLANFQAQQGGLRNLAGVNEAYQGRITGAENKLGNMLWTERFNQQTAMPGMASTPMSTLPTYSQYRQRSQPKSIADYGFSYKQPQSDGMIDFSGTDWYQSGGELGKSHYKYPTPDASGNIDTLGFNTQNQEDQTNNKKGKRAPQLQRPFDPSQEY